MVVSSSNLYSNFSVLDKGMNLFPYILQNMSWLIQVASAVKGVEILYELVIVIKNLRENNWKLEETKND